MKPGPAISARSSQGISSLATTASAIFRGFALSDRAACMAKLVAKSPKLFSGGVSSKTGGNSAFGNIASSMAAVAARSTAPASISFISIHVPPVIPPASFMQIRVYYSSSCATCQFSGKSAHNAEDIASVTVFSTNQRAYSFEFAATTVQGALRVDVRKSISSTATL